MEKQQLRKYGRLHIANIVLPFIGFIFLIWLLISVATAGAEAAAGQNEAATFAIAGAAVSGLAIWLLLGFLGLILFIMTIVGTVYAFSAGSILAGIFYIIGIFIWIFAFVGAIIALVQVNRQIRKS
ncbi:hypothetical protein [Metamycoplasma alkalescens]|uniref:hypothetical protein n=1 Tax=Metamycoplasma alkalescens TaxID=45363 RepID=UPI003D092B6B